MGQSKINSRLEFLFLIIASGFAAVVSLIWTPLSSSAHVESSFPGWPTHYEGKLLKRLELSEREKGFVQRFPGKIARFSDGNREIIIRWIQAPTRQLHPASDCFRGVGYSIKFLPMQTNKAGNGMGCFAMTKGSSRLRVCEFIKDQSGNSWSDVSSWYWHSLFSNKNDHWWSYVIGVKLADIR